MNAREQYAQITGIKAAWPQQNSPPGCPHRAALHAKVRDVLAHMPEGARVLDVGCDDPAEARGLWPGWVDHVGLDPAGAPGAVLGAAEALPFDAASFDVVAFVTSLDHVLDCRVALREASRVLRPQGACFVFTLVWPDAARCDLAPDGVHWHHFMPGQVQSAMSGLFQFAESAYLSGWKGDTHRYVELVRGVR